MLEAGLPSPPACFVFGDFNFRLDMPAVVRHLCGDIGLARAQAHEGKEPLRLPAADGTGVALEFGPKKFRLGAPRRIVDDMARLRSFDREVDGYCAFAGEGSRLRELTCSFPPSYNYDPDADPSHVELETCYTEGDRDGGHTRSKVRRGTTIGDIGIMKVRRRTADFNRPCTCPAPTRLVLSLVPPPQHTHAPPSPLLPGVCGTLAHLAHPPPPPSLQGASRHSSDFVRTTSGSGSAAEEASRASLRFQHEYFAEDDPTKARRSHSLPPVASSASSDFSRGTKESGTSSDSAVERESVDRESSSFETGSAAAIRRAVAYQAADHLNPKRCPAWCDRVLMDDVAWALVEGAEGGEYDSSFQSPVLSDHNPVTLLVQLR